MKKITSFMVNHDILMPGIYISRIDNDIVTYDLRTRKPNSGDYINTSTMHSLEHMFATYIRNSPLSDKVVYFGPMGCQTGYYLLMRNLSHKENLALILETLEKIISHKGDIFGNSSIECGNYKTLSVENAKKEAELYLNILKEKDNIDFNYPNISL